MSSRQAFEFLALENEKEEYMGAVEGIGLLIASQGSSEALSSEQRKLQKALAEWTKEMGYVLWY